MGMKLYKDDYHGHNQEDRLRNGKVYGTAGDVVKQDRCDRSACGGSGFGCCVATCLMLSGPFVCTTQVVRRTMHSGLDENVGHYGLSASDGDGNWNLDAVGGMKCGTCGSRKYGTHACDADLSKLRCFKCQKCGHISGNCSERRKGKGPWTSHQRKGQIEGKER